MSKIKDLKPELVWKYFYEITQIPRPSKKEERIIAYLENFSKENKLKYKKDEVGNILIIKPATSGMEQVKTVVLQSHVDMVCEKNSDVNHNFDTDPIETYIDGEWVKAKGTTLGADNGIGVATQLAVLADKTIKHGAIECLFTVDEETGLTGANKLGKDFFKAEILLNLDSEDEGEIYIGCAGGIDTLISYPLKYKEAPEENTACQIFVSGLNGGHSGDDINKGFCNANKILTRLLWHANQEMIIKLADFQGGNLRNAIPREAMAIITVPEKSKKELIEFVHSFEAMVKNEVSNKEPNLKIEIKACDPVKEVLKDKNKNRLLNALLACPNGVIAMSSTISGLVETSTNLASVHFKDKRYADIVTSQRSSIETSKIEIANRIISTFSLIGAKTIQTDSYPGWTPNTDSEILKVAESSYNKLYSVVPQVKAIHAGLECGLFLEKYPNLDMISIGPTMRGVHSPDERMHIESVDKFWKFLIKILEDIPSKR